MIDIYSGTLYRQVLFVLVVSKYHGNPCHPGSWGGSKSTILNLLMNNDMIGWKSLFDDIEIFIYIIT